MKQPLLKNARNKQCFCGSGKKYKNCHEDIYIIANLKINQNQRRIDQKIHELAIKIKGDYKLVGDEYKWGFSKDSRENCHIYEISGYTALKVDYGDIPMNLDTPENAERVAKVDIYNDIKIEVLYKSPKEEMNGTKE